MTLPLTEEDLHELYVWVDNIPISRPKKNIARDFSDGCCVAEVVKFFFPKLVDLHNYTPAMSMKQKVDNWDTLNNRVFRKLHFEVPQEEVNDITAAVPGAIERFLRALRTKVAQIKARREEIGCASSDPHHVATPSPPLHDPRHPHHHHPHQQQQQQQQQQQKKTKKGEKMFGESGNGNRPGSPAWAHCTNSPAAYRSPSAANEAPANAVSFRLLLDEKDRTIYELRETVGLLSEKVSKLEELVRVKDEKLNAYRATMGRI